MFRPEKGSVYIGYYYFLYLHTIYASTKAYILDIVTGVVEMQPGCVYEGHKYCLPTLCGS